MKTRLIVAGIAALIAGTAISITTSGSNNADGLTGVAAQALGCGQTYTLSLSLSDGTTTVPQYSNEYVTPACATTTPTQTTTTPTGTTTTGTGTTTTPSTIPPPNGPSGTWTLIFDDEFNTTKLNTGNWGYHSGAQNNATDLTTNVKDTGGNLVLTTSGSSTGAQVISTTPLVKVGDYAQASVNAPTGNWDAWWISGSPWPAAGEGDIEETLGGGPSTNYHYSGCPSSCQDGPYYPKGTWTGAFHTYGLYRTATKDYVYWDGKLVETMATHDNGAGESLYLTAGAGSNTGGQLKVGYVRVWAAG